MGRGRGRGRAPCCAKVGLNKGSWTPEEDVRLIVYIQKHGHGNWRALPKHAGLLRCGKSCRLRWINYLRPDIKRGNFTKEEEETIVRLHDLLGNKWSKIASSLPGRTDNEIKNVWNTHLKKRLALSSKEPTTAALGNYSEEALSSNSSSASCYERDHGQTDKEGDRTEILKPDRPVDDELIDIPIDTGMDHLWSLLDGDQSNITPSSSSSVELINEMNRDASRARDRLRKDEEAKDHHQLTTISDLVSDPDIWSMIGDDGACSFTPELETMEGLHSDGQLSNYTCDWLEYLEEELGLRSDTAAAMNNQEILSKMEGDNNNNNVSCCFQTRPFSPSHLDHVDFRVS